MNLVELAGALGALGVALLVGHGLSRASSLPQDSTRFETLDGLRGLLACFVFISHCAVWYGAFHALGWREPRSRLLMHFGQSSVVLFFMVTAFLFFGRLIDGRRQGVDWLRLYVSRIMRLTPAYFLAMLLMFGTLALAVSGRVDGAGTGIVLRSWPDIFGACAIWLGFSILGTPAIDAYMNTPLIVAGVTWSLPFEWSFYFVLPILALALRVSMPLWALVLGLAGVLWLFLWQPAAVFAWPFLGGMLAAVLVRVPGFAPRLRGSLAGVAVMSALAVLVAACDTPYSWLGWTLLTFVFVVIASGNTLFGLLTLPSTRTLGRVAYSIYLLHGIVLYVALMVLVGSARASTWSAATYWTLVAGLTVVVVGLSFLSFRLVEAPAMRSVSAIVGAMRRVVDCVLALRPGAIKKF